MAPSMISRATVAPPTSSATISTSGWATNSRQSVVLKMGPSDSGIGLLSTERLHTAATRRRNPSFSAIWPAFSARMARVPEPTLPRPTMPTFTSRIRFIMPSGRRAPGFPEARSARCGPVQKLVQELKRAFSVNGVAAVEEFDAGAVFQAQLRIEPAGTGVFVRHPLVPAYPVVVAALHHKRPRRDQVGHLRIVEGAAHVEIRHFPFDGVHEAEGLVGGGHFAGPTVEIARADRQAVALQDGGHAHGSFASVAQAVESYARGVHHRQGGQPAQDLVVLADDEGEQRAFHAVGFAAQPTVAVLSAVEVVRGEGDETLLGQARGEVVIVGVVAFHHLAREALAPMLADHHGPALAGANVLGHEQDAPGEDVRPDVQHHFVAGVLFRIVDA